MTQEQVEQTLVNADRPDEPAVDAMASDPISPITVEPAESEPEKSTPRKRRTSTRKKAVTEEDASLADIADSSDTPVMAVESAADDSPITRPTRRSSRSSKKDDEPGAEKAPARRSRRKSPPLEKLMEKTNEDPETDTSSEEAEETAKTKTPRRSSRKSRTAQTVQLELVAPGDFSVAPQDAQATPINATPDDVAPPISPEGQEKSGEVGTDTPAFLSVEARPDVPDQAEPENRVENQEQAVPPKADSGEPDEDTSLVSPSVPQWEDEGVLRHILPPLDERADRSRRRSSRSSRSGQQPDSAQPELPVPYGSEYDDSSVLGSVLSPARTEDDADDDGPQPILPDQPSLALPAATLEEDLEALDAQVNGNQAEPPLAPAHADKGRFRKSAQDEDEDRRFGKAGRKKALPDKKAAAPAEQEEDELPVRKGKRKLYVSVVPEEQVEVVITDNGMVTEYFVEMAHQAKIRGNIYKGVVNNIDTNLQAAFVNFGGGKNGFLQIDEVHPEYWLVPHDGGKGGKYPPIQKVMKVGQEVLVQVVKEPVGSKGAFLTTWVSLAGRFLVLTPGQEQIGVSRKVEDPAERARLKELLAGIEPGENMGVIIRTASEGASKTSIQKDLQYLKRLWKDIQKKVTIEKAPSLIYREADLAARSVRDYLAEDIEEIWVDNEQVLHSIRDTTGLVFPKRPDMIRLHQDPRQTLWERFNLQRQLEEVTSREVILPSGGRLVFDQTEALMAIDINSGKVQGKTSNFEAMVFRTNMEAAEAIARHLRLRDIGGQVVIDFIEMKDRGHCREVEKALRTALRQDRARHDVGRMSSFGLLELVRQRTGTSAISISTEPCPHCHGTGVRRNLEWQALQALRDIQTKLARVGQEKSRQDNARPSVTYELDHELALYVLNNKRDRLSDMENRYGGRVEIRLKA